MYIDLLMMKQNFFFGVDLMKAIFVIGIEFIDLLQRLFKTKHTNIVSERDEARLLRCIAFAKLSSRGINTYKMLLFVENYRRIACYAKCLQEQPHHFLLIMRKFSVFRVETSFQHIPRRANR